MINMSLLLSSLPVLFQGLLLSLQISLGAFFIGITGGTLLALSLLSSQKILNYIATGYVVIFRGTPMIIQLLIIYIFLPTIGIFIQPFFSAIIAIGMNSAAYMSQVIKGGIQGINFGEIEAARTLGLNEFQIKKYIILPQAVKNALPSLINECITLLKDSSLAHIIGVCELTYQGNIIIGQTYDSITIYTGVGLLYFLTTSVATIFFYFYERKYHDIKN
jgi:His/Glu/Gln/Arg/opine family amino acid ABC transporter permease subunit